MSGLWSCTAATAAAPSSRVETDQPSRVRIVAPRRQPAAHRRVARELLARRPQPLLLADGLTALQTATIASALPFTLALLFSTRGLLKALKLDTSKNRLFSA